MIQLKCKFCNINIISFDEDSVPSEAFFKTNDRFHFDNVSVSKPVQESLERLQEFVSICSLKAEDVTGKEIRVLGCGECDARDPIGMALFQNGSVDQQEFYIFKAKVKMN